MTTTKDLEDRMEQLVREHIATFRLALNAAIDRALASARVARRPPRPARPRAGSSRPTLGRRRGPDEMAALGERLYEAVRANPGALMGVLAAQVGAGPRELSRPAWVLKKTGRVRSVGQRGHTRYFPMATKTPSAE